MKVLALIACVLAVSTQTSWAGYPVAHHGYPYSYGGYPYNLHHGYGAALPYGLHAYGPYAHGAYAHGAYTHGIHAHGAYTNVHHAPAYKAAAYAYKPAYAPYAHVYGVSQQYHAQDALGGYSYGYTDGLSSKKETRTPYGGTVGSYSYVDAEGKHQTVSYVADGNGFRVKATNLPVAPSAESAPAAEAPAPVEDTAEVKAAKEQFKKLYDEAAAAAEQAPDTPAVIPEHSYHRYRRSAVPKPVEDTPSVKAAKAHHAYLYNKAAAAAAAAPDYHYGHHGYNGYHGLHGLHGHYGYPVAGVYGGYHGHYPGYYAAPYYNKGFSYAYSTPHTAPLYHSHHY